MRCSIIILAGGKSSRMGYEKGLMPFEGKPLIQYLIDRFQNKYNELIIISNNKEYSQFGLPVIKDNYINCGPLSGIEAGLSASKNNINIIISCDSPFVETTLVDHVLKQNTNSDILFTFYKKIHPFPGLYSKNIKNKLKQLIIQGERKVTSLNDHFAVSHVVCKSFNKANFINFNSQKDIEDWHEINC